MSPCIAFKFSAINDDMFQGVSHISRPRSKFHANKISFFWYLLLQEVIENLRGPGLVLIDPPYEPYNEYLTWNLYTIRTFLGFKLQETQQGGKDWFRSLTESVTRLQEVWPEASIAMWYPCTDPQQRRSVKLRLEDARRNDKLNKLQSLKQDFTPFFNITRSSTDMLIWNTQYSKFNDLMLGFAEVLVYLLEFILVVVMRNHLKRSFRIWSWSWIVVF